MRIDIVLTLPIFKRPFFPRIGSTWVKVLVSPLRPGYTTRRISSMIVVHTKIQSFRNVSVRFFGVETDQQTLLQNRIKNRRITPTNSVLQTNRNGGVPARNISLFVRRGWSKFKSTSSGTPQGAFAITKTNWQIGSLKTKIGFRCT